MDGPWIVEPLRLASGQELVFEPGVVVQGKAGSFRGGSDSLCTAWAARDITLTGYGATLAMRRSDYASGDYAGEIEPSTHAQGRKELVHEIHAARLQSTYHALNAAWPDRCTEDDKLSGSFDRRHERTRA